MNDIEDMIEQMIGLSERQSKLAVELGTALNARMSEADNAIAALHRFRSSTVEPEQPAEAEASKNNKAHIQYADRIFLEALKPNFQTQAELRRALQKTGVSAGTIHSRFKKLANDPASGVERNERAEYRLIKAKAGAVR